MSLGTLRKTVLCSVAIVFAFSAFSHDAAWAQQLQATGGFIDSSTSNGLRPRLSSGEIQTFVPQRGPFTFPAPYSTQGVRITNASDCGGQDCVHSVGYSYWANMNNHVGSDTILVFLGLERNSGGGGPTLFSYNKKSGQVQNLGPLFSADSKFSWATGEGWYFSATQPHTLYMNDGPNMLRYDVINHTFSTVFNVESILGAGRILWQMHSSDDDLVHSATVRDSSSYAMLGCIAYDEAHRWTPQYIAAKGDFDECQVDKSGHYLVIKENVTHATSDDDNRIINLDTGAETLFTDKSGAAGHSDLGYGYIVGEDNYYPQPGATRLWKLNQDLSGDDMGHAAGQGTLVYQTTSWDVGLGHVAHGNAKPGDPTSQMACVSNASRENLPRVNEIVCFRLDGSMQTLVVAPNMVDLNAAGGGSDDYWKIPMGNLDVTGEYMIWTANMGGNRQDAFIVHIPVDKLGVTPSAPTPSTPAPPVTPAPTPVTPAPPAPTTPTTPTPPTTPTTPAPPTPQPPATSGSAAIQWTMLANAVVSGNNIQKSGGCDGCPDAGGMSTQQLTTDGAVQFTASETDSLRFLGLTSGTSTVDPSAFAFAIRLQNGVAEVREYGAYRTETSFATGDTFKIVVSGGGVTYRKNGAVFYTSTAAASFPLTVNASLFSMNATLTGITMVTGAQGAIGAAPPAPTAAPSASWMMPAQMMPGTAVQSQNGQYTLIYQGDGNLVLYDSSHAPLWSSDTAGSSAGRVVMQSDGNLVIYDASGAPVWSSNTVGNPAARALVQNDGNFVVYDSAWQPLWNREQ